jgi:hypothetical protein
LQSEVEARKQEIHLLEAPSSSDGLSPGVQFSDRSSASSTRLSEQASGTIEHGEVGFA